MPHEHTYAKYHPLLIDQVNLQDLIDQLGDFLLQSGFTGGQFPYFGDDEFPEDNRSLDALRQAIMQALLESGQLTPEMVKYLRGESTGDEDQDADREEWVKSGGLALPEG